MMSTATPAPVRTRKPRGLSKLKPRHYDYLRLRQAGKSQKEAASLTNLPIATAQRCERHPDGAKYLQDIAENARIAAQYGLAEAVKEVDKAIAFNYDIENGNAIAKLLEHKSKLYGLLVERVDVKTTYIDLKGALEQAKDRVLTQLNTLDRGISVHSIPAPSPASLPKGNILTDSPTPQPSSDSTEQADQSIDNAPTASCFDIMDASSTSTAQADSTTTET